MKEHPVKQMAIWLFLILILPPVQITCQVIRKPYLQIPTPDGVVICWISGTGVPGEVYYGTNPDSLDRTPEGKEEQYFFTPPEEGRSMPVRIWVISDFGQTNSDQNDERLETVARWKAFNNGSHHADFVLPLGDQTEDDSRYQLQHNYFSQLETVLPAGILNRVPFSRCIATVMSTRGLWWSMRRGTGWM